MTAVEGEMEGNVEHKAHNLLPFQTKTKQRFNLFIYPSSHQSVASKAGLPLNVLGDGAAEGALCQHTLQKQRRRLACLHAETSIFIKLE